VTVGQRNSKRSDIRDYKVEAQPRMSLRSCGLRTLKAISAKRYSSMPFYDFLLWAGDFVRFPAAGFCGAGWKLSAAEVAYVKHGTREWDRHFKAMRKKYSQYSASVARMSEATSGIPEPTSVNFDAHRGPDSTHRHSGI
jgi:hypothetical protein